MEVKKGYKQTEIGIIPEDWEVYKIYDICSLSKKRYNPKLSKEVYKCIELEHLSQETGRLLDYCFSDQQFSIKSFFEKEDVLFGKLRPYLKKFYYAEINGVCSTEIWVLKSKTHILSKYLYYLIQTKIILDAANQSTGTKMPRADWNFISNILVFLPPLTEQTAIANALSDIDALVESLEKLITKKRNIKQGAMQQLLTGKKRLPGFGGDGISRKGYKQTEIGIIPKDWEVKTLDDLFCVSGGFPIPREKLSDDGFCYLHYGDIHKSERTFIDVTKDFFRIPKLKIPIGKIHAKSLLKDGDIVFVDASEDEEGASKHIVIRNSKNISFISGLHTIVLKSKDQNLGNKYKQFCFKSQDIKNQFYYFATGTKVFGISKSNIKKIQIPLPALCEQTAIAEVLSDMDTEIEALEKKLNKYKKVKQGMMQELLTGKKRLI